MLFNSKYKKREKLGNVHGRSYIFVNDGRDNITCDVTDEKAIKWFMDNGYRPVEDIKETKKDKPVETKKKRKRRTPAEMKADKEAKEQAELEAEINTDLGEDNE
jgi:hypothetical protein